jgi:hypothetical protein
LLPWIREWQLLHERPITRALAAPPASAPWAVWSAL